MSSPESLPNLPPVLGEFPSGTQEQLSTQNIERSPEQVAEKAGEHHQATTAVPVPIVLPVPVQDDTTATSLVPVQDDMPLVANDEDLIEKEWVDKAKKIIAETKDDPHLREKEVGKLQADYLRKRYGKELGATDEA